MALSLVALVLAAIAAPGGQAQTSPASQPEAGQPEGEASARGTHIAEREQRRAANREQREAERASRQQELLAQRQARWVTVKERAGNVVSVGCSAVTVTFNGFPNAPGNVVVEKVAVRDKVLAYRTFMFSGPTGKDTIPIVAPIVSPSHYQIDVRVKWHTNGVRGGFDIPVKASCGPLPGYTIEKLQAIAGSGQPPSGGPLAGQVGQTVDYQIVLHNTGNVPLTFSAFEDPRCDPGTIAGGPGSGEVPVGASSTFTCTHTLTAADEQAGSYANTAFVTGTPPLGDGPPTDHESNTVVVTPVTAPGQPPPPGTTTPPGQPPTTTTTTNTAPGSGVGAFKASSSGTPGGGVLSFSAAVPALQGPQGCVRGRFHVSVKSKGVASVVFYLDGHRVRKLTAHSARRGLLSVTIDASRLRVGTHRVVAKITMNRASAAKAGVHASRSVMVVRCASAAISPHFTG